MKTNFFTGFLAIVAMSFLGGCTDKIEQEGPDLVDLFGDFNVLEPIEGNQNSVDFASGEAFHLKARFNKVTDWSIRIRGLETGGLKLIEGRSRSLDESNTLWDGSTTRFPVFSEERVAIEVSVPEGELVWRDTIEVVTKKVNEGFLIADFEAGINSKWLRFAQSGANMSFRINDADTAAQGDFYYDMGGEVNWDWLIGMIEFPASAYDVPTFPLNSDPSKVYFNALVYLPKSITNALVLFQFREDENGDGNFNTNNEDLYSIELTTDLSEGWNLVSLKYSDLVSLVNGQPATPAGNGLHEPQKLWRVSTLFLANPASGYSQIYLDYVIFTENEPLKP